MTYPTAPPEMRIVWDNTTDYESSAVVSRMNGGVDFRSDASQLNRFLASRQIEVVADWNSYLIIDAFLVGRDGQPFYFSDVLYVCKSYSWTLLSYSDGVPDIQPEYGLMRLSANLEEVIRPV